MTDSDLKLSWTVADMLAASGLFIVCLLATLWAIMVFWTEDDRLFALKAERMANEGRWSITQLEGAGSRLAPYQPDCRQEFKRALSSVAVSTVQQSSTSNNSLVDTAISALREELNCSPASSNTWLLLAAMELRKGTAPARIYRHLSLSYQYGPREAWIAERRPGVVCFLTNVDESDPLWKAAGADFKAIIANGRYDAAVAIYRHCPEVMRGRFDRLLAGMPNPDKQAFVSWIAKGKNRK